MRHFIDIVQQAMSDRPLLCEGDVTDFEEFRKKRAQGDGQSPNTAIPGSLRYVAALDQQQNQPPANLSDHLRTLVLRNLDAAFGNGEWQPDDLHTIRVFVKHWNSEDRRKVQPLVNKALSLAGKRDDVRYFIGSPSRRSAYLKDNEMLAHWRLETRPETKPETFETEEDLFYHILKHMVVADDGQWSEDELTHMTEYLVKVEDRRTRNPGKDDWNPAADDDEGPFDPRKIPLDYEGNPLTHSLSPWSEKFLQQFDYSRGDDTPYFICATHGYSGDKIELTFSRRGLPPRKKEFPTVAAMDAWIQSHEKAIVEWAGRQERRQISQKAIIRKCLDITLKQFKEIAAGTATVEAIQQNWNDYAMDLVRSISNQRINDLFWNMYWLAKDEKRWAETDWGFYETWLPQRVKEMLAEEG